MTELSASDKAALRGLAQRNGGPLSPERQRRLSELGLVVFLEHVADCYPDRRPSYGLTPKGRALVSGIKDRAK